jgi:hypothetical protein
MDGITIGVGLSALWLGYCVFVIVLKLWGVGVLHVFLD